MAFHIVLPEQWQTLRLSTPMGIDNKDKLKKSRTIVFKFGLSPAGSRHGKLYNFFAQYHSHKHTSNSNGRRRTFLHMHRTKTQISLRIRTVWSESSLSAWRNFTSLAIQNAHSEDSDQTTRMRRLIWIFTGRSCSEGRFSDVATRFPRLKLHDLYPLLHTYHVLNYMLTTSIWQKLLLSTCYTPIPLGGDSTALMAIMALLQNLLAIMNHRLIRLDDDIQAIWRRRAKRFWVRPWLSAGRRLQFGHYEEQMIVIRRQHCIFCSIIWAGALPV